MTEPFFSIEINKYNFIKIGHTMDTSFRTIAFSKKVLNRFALLMLLGAQNSWGATFTVTTGADAGAGSLRSAVNNALSGDTITFTPNLLVTLGSPLNIAEDIIFDGNGATIDGQTNSLTYSNVINPLIVTGANNLTFQNFGGSGPTFSSNGLLKTGTGTLTIGIDDVVESSPSHSVTPLITQNEGKIQLGGQPTESLLLTGGNCELLFNSALQELTQTGGIFVTNQGSDLTASATMSGGRFVNHGDVSSAPTFSGNVQIYGNGRFFQPMVITASQGVLTPSIVTDPFGTFTVNPGAMTTAEITVNNLQTFAVVTSATSGSSSLNVVSGLGSLNFAANAPLTNIVVIAKDEPGYVVTQSTTASTIISTANGITKNNIPIGKAEDVFSGTTGTFTTSTQTVTYQFELDPGNVNDIIFRITGVTALNNGGGSNTAPADQVQNTQNTITAGQKVQQKTQDQVTQTVLSGQLTAKAVANNCANFLDSRGIAPNEAFVLNRLVANANLTDLRQTVEKIGQNRAISQNPNDLPSEILPGKLPALIIPGQGQNVWLQPMASIVHQKKDKEIGGFDSKSGGFIAGYSYEANKKFGMGVFAGFSGSKTHYKDNGGHTNTTSPFVGLNASYGWCETTFLSTSFTYSRPHNHHRRTLTANVKGHGKQNQNMYSIDLNLTRLKITQNAWVFLPYLEFGYNINHDLGFKERSSTGMTMKHKENHSTGIKAGAGLMFSKVFSLESALATPQFTIGYRGRKQMTGTKFRLETSSGGVVGSTSQTGTIRKTGRNEINLGVAVGGFIKNTWQVSAGYQASLWKRYHAHDFVIGVKRKI